MMFTCDDPVHKTLVSEIERLREANQAQTNVSRALQAEIERLRADNQERYEALRRCGELVVSDLWLRQGDCSACGGTGDEIVDSMTLYGIPGGFDVGGPCPSCEGSGSALVERAIASLRRRAESAERELEIARAQQYVDSRWVRAEVAEEFQRRAESAEAALREIAAGRYTSAWRLAEAFLAANPAALSPEETK